jgi:hypothetical protein
MANITADRNGAFKLLDILRDEWDMSDKEILEYLVYNWMSGSTAYQAMVDTFEEYDLPIPGKEEDME